MAYFVALPSRSGVTDPNARAECYVNLINGDGTLVQRELRRNGFGGYEPATASVACALWQHIVDEGGTSADPPIRFFDVGANGGFYSVLCKGLHRERAHVAAFEPAPDTFYWLQAINDVNRLGIDTRQLALTDRVTELTLYLSAKSDASNSLNPDFKARHKGTATVQATTLDRFCEEQGSWPNVLKIDVETHEAQVLTGALQLLREHRPYLILEAINKNGTDYGQAMASILDSVGGYRYYHIEEAGLSLRPTITAEPKATHRDWLIAPVALADSFHASVARWRETLSECGSATNISSKYGGEPPPPRSDSPPPQGKVAQDKVARELAGLLPAGSKRRKATELAIDFVKLFGGRRSS